MTDSHAGSALPAPPVGGAGVVEPHERASTSGREAPRPCVPRATLRLQLHAEFTLADALAHVDYYAALGVSHLYLSPVTVARRGSRHGYDVVDPTRVNPELGGEQALRELAAALRARGMGIILDIVPNHMAVGHADNAWWLDVLEWGRDSPHAGFFDIDWDTREPTLHGKVLCPFLGKPYGEALDAGEIELRLDARHGRFQFSVGPHALPLAPTLYAPLLHEAGLHPLASAFTLPVHAPRARRRADFEAARAQLAAAAPAHADALRNLLARYVCEPRALHPLLEQQHHRLAWWRCAADEINWRRFFDITELAGLRMQEPAVFEAVHALPLRLYAEGIIDGLRIDHVDGLNDPRRYCRTLRSRLAALERERPAAAPRGAAYVIVEKILGPGERLRQDWLTDGTTGYAFMDQVGALLADARGESPLSRLWAQVCGREAPFEVEERRARRHIARALFTADFNACAHALHAVARADIHTRDWSLAAIERVLTEMLVHFPVYRTYADARGRAREDAEVMARVVEATRAALPPSDYALLGAIDRWLGGEPPQRLRSAVQRSLRLRACGRFQQLTAPIAAKAVEDTAFYRHGRLLARNEVGADPGRLALDVDEFHRSCLERQRRFPHAMLATATHDHKRGEDLRARLAVLSELPDWWADEVRAVRALTAPLRRDGAPDAADEYMLLQTLVGAWPPELVPDDDAGLERFRDRLWTWQLKAVREAKRRTGWTEPNQAYEDGCRHFLWQLFDRAAGTGPRARLHAMAERLAIPGARNALTQALLRMTAPGVPDLYQGTECWDFSLVDPDNRQPVDFDGRAQRLADVPPLPELLRDWRDGRIKQWLVARVLALRARESALFARGRYQPLAVSGARAAHVVAFARSLPQRTLIVVASRHTATLPGAETQLSLREVDWGDTAIALPAGWRGTAEDVLTGQAHRALGARLRVGEVLAQVPVALLLAAR